jgi:hypothetical protein
MEHSRRLLPLAVLPLMAILFITGAAGFSRFSPGVRPVAVVGLSGSGFSIGVGFAFLVLIVLSLTGRR